MEKVLFAMSLAYLHHRKMYFLKESKDSIRNNEYKKHVQYSEKYDIIRELFWIRFNKDYERVKELCIKKW